MRQPIPRGNIIILILIILGIPAGVILFFALNEKHVKPMKIDANLNAPLLRPR